VIKNSIAGRRAKLEASLGIEKASLGVEQKVSLDIEQKGSLIGKGKTKRTAKNEL
jgi:hypothetical protein